ncbi:MAG: manganese efflux pump MntP [Syntrophorhabdus sp. PtaU1.Bin153]|nr:MAG: manganese efflux pump MntP [Syntrophorhabdus sp. PtaU1.Bin153]
MQGFHLISILSVASSSSADNLTVGIAFGIKGTRLPFTSNLLISLLNGAGTLVSMVAGNTIAGFLKPERSTIAGATVIIAVGVWAIIQEIRLHYRAESPGEQPVAARTSTSITRHTVFRRIFSILNNPCTADRDISDYIDIKEGFLLGLALTFTNLVSGLAAGLMGLSVALTTFFAVIFNFAAMWFGIRAGCSVGYRWLGHLAGPLSGLLLISVGVYEIFF